MIFSIYHYLISSCRLSLIKSLVGIYIIYRLEQIEADKHRTVLVLALLSQGGYFKRHKRTSVLAKWFEYDVNYELPQLNANLRYRYNLSPYVTIMA